MTAAPTSTRFIGPNRLPGRGDRSAIAPNEGVTWGAPSPYPADVLIATALWWMTPELLTAIDRELGAPVDSYVNGSQTWFTGDEETLEWRLHPVAAFTLPAGLSHYDLWERVVDEITAGRSAEALQLGDETRPLTAIWDGLECFPAYGDDLEPATLSRRASELVGIAPHQGRQAQKIGAPFGG